MEPLQALSTGCATWERIVGCRAIIQLAINIRAAHAQRNKKVISTMQRQKLPGWRYFLAKDQQDEGIATRPSKVQGEDGTYQLTGTGITD
jgi:hypothetical protein